MVKNFFKAFLWVPLLDIVMMVWSVWFSWRDFNYAIDYRDQPVMSFLAWAACVGMAYVTYWWGRMAKKDWTAKFTQLEEDRWTKKYAGDER